MQAIYLVGRMQDRNYVLQVAHNLLKEGFAVFIPNRINGLIQWSNEGDLEMLRRADAAYVMLNYTESESAKDDLAWAKRYGKIIYIEGRNEPA